MIAQTGRASQHRRDDHANSAGGDQRELHSEGGGEHQHRRRSDCTAKHAGKGVDGESAADTRGGNPRRHDRVIGRVIDRIRDADQSGRCEQPEVGIDEPDRGDRQPAQPQCRDEQSPRADAIGEISHRQLRGDRSQRADRQREAELDKTDAEMLFQVREQRRQHEDMEMGDEMRRRDEPDRLNLAASH